MAALISGALTSVIIGAFWFQDWQYSLPTPRPVELVQPALGSVPALAMPAREVAIRGSKPLLLHFFNPDCPCSRFNIDHVRRLVHDYGAKVRFIAVIQAVPGSHASERVRAMHLPMPYVIDTDGRIAKSYGVYSTPQAVVLTAQGALYYRGNYNISRYCTHHSTEFARQALISLLASCPSAMLPAAANTAYGCQLPSNKVLPAGGDFTAFCQRKLSLIRTTPTRNHSQEIVP